MPNAKFDSEQARAQAVNAVEHQDARAKPGTISYLKMQLVLRMVVLKVMRENGIDAFVNPGEHAAAVQARPRLRADGEQSRLEGLWRRRSPR